MARAPWAARPRPRSFYCALASGAAAAQPGCATEAINQAIEELTRDRSRMSPVAANREVYRLLKNGVRVPVSDPEGDGETVEMVRVMDWDNPANNDFLLCSQFWVTGEMYKRRADLVGFVNGLPLVFIELKAAHRRLENAFTGQPARLQGHHPAALLVQRLHHPLQRQPEPDRQHHRRMGALRRVEEDQQRGRSRASSRWRPCCAARASRRGCWTWSRTSSCFRRSAGGLIKLVAKNHQYLGVNNALARPCRNISEQPRAGWASSGTPRAAARAISMVFFAQKVLRKLPGNWTFVVVTDRQELDDQIYKNFATAGAVTEGRAPRPSSGEHLQQLLREDHRYVFTLIQKFRTETGETLSRCSPSAPTSSSSPTRRTAASTTRFALNMRNALPNAAFIGFTGTPLMAGEEKTREVFGDYVSIYNFQQSMDDGATVPLYYENRIPELQLTNDEPERRHGAAARRGRAGRGAGGEAGAGVRPRVPPDHPRRPAGDRSPRTSSRTSSGAAISGKAMVVCIDKATAVRMYDKVQKYWTAQIAAA